VDSRENAEKAKEGSDKVADETTEAAGKMSDQAAQAGEKVGEAAKDAGHAIKEGAKEVASEIDDKKQTVDVKTALMADKSVDASHIDVDTVADTKTVTLKGSVPSQAQKVKAEQIARDKAEGFRVVNHLTVSGRS
jgi:hyperosmotically inducible protein